MTPFTKMFITVFLCFFIIILSNIFICTGYINNNYINTTIIIVINTIMFYTAYYIATNTYYQEINTNTKTNKTMKLLSIINIISYIDFHSNNKLKIYNGSVYTTNQAARNGKYGTCEYYIEELGCYAPTSWFVIHPDEFKQPINVSDEKYNKALSWWRELTHTQKIKYCNKHYPFIDNMNTLTSVYIHNIWLKEGKPTVLQPVKSEPIVPTQVVLSYSIGTVHQCIREMIEKGYEVVSMTCYDGCSILVVFNKPKHDDC